MGTKRRRYTPIRSCSGVNDCGFTLIEVLIATLILSLVIYLAATAYSLFLSNWQKKGLLETTAIQEYRSRILVRTALESIYDYYVTDPASERANWHFPFFKGEEDSMVFVTLSSVFHKGRPAVGRLRVEKEGTDHTQSLVYEEAGLQDTYLRYDDDPIDYNRKITLFDHTRQIRLRYFGAWDTRFVPEKNAFETEYRWLETYQGKERGAIPDVIEISVASEGEETRLAFPVMAHNPGKGLYFNRDR